MPGGSEFILVLLIFIAFFIFLFRVWKMTEKRKEQRQEMEILLLAKIAEKLGVEQSTISEIIKTL